MYRVFEGHTVDVRLSVLVYHTFLSLGCRQMPGHHGGSGRAASKPSDAEEKP